MSSLHPNNNIAESGKPEIVEFYNKNKAGVDALDQIVCHYTAYHKSHRWSLAVFCNILDMSTYNAYFYSRYALLPKVLIILPMLVSNFCVLLVSSYSNLTCFWELIIPMAWICQLKMLSKYLVLQLRTKRSKGMTDRPKNEDASYVHAKEIEKSNKNTLNAIITCGNNIQRNYFVMTALKRRLKIEHFTEQQFLQKYCTFWLFLDYRDILTVLLT